jgi:hypothetical protein
MRYVTCGYNLNIYFDQLFALTVQIPFLEVKCQLLNKCDYNDFMTFYYSNENFFDNTVQLRVSFWFLCSSTFIFASLILNTCTIIDLYMMIYNPFKNLTKKVKKMLITALLISFILAIIGLIETRDMDQDKAKNSDYLFWIMTIFNIFFALIAMAFVYARLNKGGMSSELKSQISRRYLEFVIIFVILSWPINNLFRPEYKYNSSIRIYQAGTNYATGYKTPICGFGIIMAISRLRDPLIRIKTMNIWMNITCRSQSIKEDINKELKKTNLNAFLRSTLNTELVISILKGITILAATSSDNVDNIADSDMLRVR